MKQEIKIDSNLETPIYLQIAYEVERLVSEKLILKGEQLPAINEIQARLKIGRVTVVKAYDELKKRGTIRSTQGKGFYIATSKVKIKKKVFLLFDALNDYKEVLYRSLVGELGNNYDIDSYFHYYNLSQFKRFITDNIDIYDHYVVLPHFNKDVSDILEIIPREKLLIMDKQVEPLNEGYAAIYQNFEKDVFKCLCEGALLISKYKRINLVKDGGFQFIPQGIVDGFVKFCEHHNYNYRFIEAFDYADIHSGEAYLIISNGSLVKMLTYANEYSLTPGKDIGIISYDDTPLKSILANGITVITTDFVNMGKMGAKMIKDKIYSQFENPARLIIRKSL